jgi:hypothetical protein
MLNYRFTRPAFALRSKVRVFIIGKVLPTGIKPMPALVADVDRLFGANEIGTGNNGQRVIISAVDQCVVSSAVNGSNSDDIRTEDKGIFTLHSWGQTGGTQYLSLCAKCEYKDFRYPKCLYSRLARDSPVWGWGLGRVATCEPIFD